MYVRVRTWAFTSFTASSTMQFPGDCIQSLFQKEWVGAVRKGCQERSGERSGDLTTRPLQIIFWHPSTPKKLTKHTQKTTESCKQRTGTADEANKDRTTLNGDETPPNNSQQQSRATTRGHCHFPFQSPSRPSLDDLSTHGPTHCTHHSSTCNSPAPPTVYTRHQFPGTPSPSLNPIAGLGSSVLGCGNPQNQTSASKARFARQRHTVKYFISSDTTDATNKRSTTKFPVQSMT